MDSTQTGTVSESRPTTPSRRGIDWVNTPFLAGTLLIALIGVPIHLATTGFSWPILGLFAFYMAATGLSITEIGRAHV